MLFYYSHFSLALVSFFCSIYHCESQPINEDPLKNVYGDIIFSSVIFRHGNRTPLATYPKDPYRDYPWPAALGQMLNASFLSSQYNASEIKSNSSDMDRTIMSGQCFLFGLCPATGSQVWLEGEMWQPITIYTISEKDDNLIRLTAKCPRLDEVYREVDDDSKMRHMYGQFEKALEYIQLHTGLNFTGKPINKVLFRLLRLWDCLMVEQENGLILPEWTQAVFPDLLTEFLMRAANHYFSHVEMNRLLIGMFFKLMITEMEEKISEPNSTTKLHVYSGHDITVNAIFAGLRITLTQYIPPYGAMLLCELRRKNDTHYVTLSYKNSSGPAVLLEIPGCEEMCTFERFVNVTQPIVPEDWHKECEVDFSYSVTTASSYYLILLTLFYHCLHK